MEEKRAAAFNRFLRAGFAELNAEERNLMRELRAQSVTTDSQGGYTVPTQMRNKIIDTMKAYGGIASVAQLLTTSTGQDITGQRLMARLKRANCWRKIQPQRNRM